MCRVLKENNLVKNLQHVQAFVMFYPSPHKRSNTSFSDLNRFKTYTDILKRFLKSENYTLQLTRILSNLT